jgi:hypothetical protein
VTTTDVRAGLAALALVVALPLALAACGDDTSDGTGTTSHGGEPDDPPGEVAAPEADFDADITVSDDGVTVTYTLANRSGGELLVVDRIPSVAGAGVSYASDAAYVTGQPDGRVQIAQRAFAWPDTTSKDWAQAPRVGVTRLADGGSVSATVEVPLPFERSQPFGDDLGDGDIVLPDPVGSTVFCLGVLPTPYDDAIGLSTEGDVTTIAHGDAANAGQHLFCSDPVDL